MIQTSHKISFIKLVSSCVSGLKRFGNYPLFTLPVATCFFVDVSLNFSNGNYSCMAFGNDPILFYIAMQWIDDYLVRLKDFGYYVTWV